MPSIAVIGANNDRSKFGNRAVRAYAALGWRVYPVHPTETIVEGLPVYRSVSDIPGERLDRVSLYVPPSVGVTLLEAIAARGADEVWLNPGADGPAVIDRARELGLNAVVACSLIAAGVE